MKKWIKRKTLSLIDAFFEGIQTLGKAGIYVNNNILKISFWLHLLQYLLAFILFFRYIGVVLNKNCVNEKYLEKDEWLDKVADVKYTFHYSRMRARYLLTKI